MWTSALLAGCQLTPEGACRRLARLGAAEGESAAVCVAQYDRLSQDAPKTWACVAACFRGGSSGKQVLACERRCRTPTASTRAPSALPEAHLVSAPVTRLNRRAVRVSGVLGAQYVAHRGDRDLTLELYIRSKPGNTVQLGEQKATAPPSGRVTLMLPLKTHVDAGKRALALPVKISNRYGRRLKGELRVDLSLLLQRKDRP